MTTTSYSRSIGFSYSVGSSCSEPGPDDTREDADGPVPSANDERIAMYKLFELTSFLGVWPTSEDTLATFAERALTALDRRVAFLDGHVRAELLAAIGQGGS